MDFRVVDTSSDGNYIPLVVLTVPRSLVCQLVDLRAEGLTSFSLMPLCP